MLKPTGKFIYIDNWRLGFVHLREGMEFVDSGFVGSKYTVETGYEEPLCEYLPINITITGRVEKWFSGIGNCKRCKVEFVNDCEPSTFAYGWVSSEL